MPTNISYGSIEKKLKSLGYKSNFHPEDAELVKSLLDDLIKVSDAYQYMKKTPEININTDKLYFSSKDTRLIENLLERENDSLHEELITLKHYIDKRELSFKFQLKTLEDKIFDLKKILEMRKDYMETVKQENHRLKLKLKEFVVDNFSSKKVKTIDYNIDYAKKMDDLITVLDNNDSKSQLIDKLQEDKLDLERKLRESDLRFSYEKEQYMVENKVLARKDEEILRLKLKCSMFEQYKQDFKQLATIKETYERKLSDLQSQYNILLRNMGYRNVNEITTYNHTTAVLKETEERLEETKAKYNALLAQNEDLLFEINKLRPRIEENNKINDNFQILLEVN